MQRTPYAHIFVLIAFMVNTLGSLPIARADDFRLPVPGVMVRLSPPLDPPMLKGIKVHPDNPFRFDFNLDKGDSELSNDQLKSESSELIKYFLASLTIPEKDLWVNLSPYEKDRIIPQSFGLTEMGRDLLGEDYMLKQITASLIYPEDEIGKKFWKRIYEEAEKRYGTTNISVNTFNKVWIVPEKAVVYENAKVGTAYVVESKLKVMLEQDYLSLAKHEGIQSKKAQTQDTNQLGSQIVREIVIPELTTEVNENKNFSRLRQVYNSLILATWYKKKIKDSILEQVYADKNKVAGVNIDDPQEKEKIYQRYLKAFKKGVYNYIKEDIDPATQETIPRKYFSGGEDFAPEGDGPSRLKGISGIETFVTSSQAMNAVKEMRNDQTLIVEANVTPSKQVHKPATTVSRQGHVPRANRDRAMNVQRLQFLFVWNTKYKRKIEDELGKRSWNEQDMRNLLGLAQEISKYGSVAKEAEPYLINVCKVAIRQYIYKGRAENPVWIAMAIDALGMLDPIRKIGVPVKEFLVDIIMNNRDFILSSEILQLLIVLGLTENEVKQLLVKKYFEILSLPWERVQKDVFEMALHFFEDLGPEAELVMPVLKERCSYYLRFKEAGASMNKILSNLSKPSFEKWKEEILQDYVYQKMFTDAGKKFVPGRSSLEDFENIFELQRILGVLSASSYWFRYMKMLSLTKAEIQELDESRWGEALDLIANAAHLEQEERAQRVIDELKLFWEDSLKRGRLQEVINKILELLEDRNVNEVVYQNYYMLQLLPLIEQSGGIDHLVRAQKALIQYWEGKEKNDYVVIRNAGLLKRNGNVSTGRWARFIEKTNIASICSLNGVALFIQDFSSESDGVILSALSNTRISYTSSSFVSQAYTHLGGFNPGETFVNRRNLQVQAALPQVRGIRGITYYPVYSPKGYIRFEDSIEVGILKEIVRELILNSAHPDKELIIPKSMAEQYHLPERARLREFSRRLDIQLPFSEISTFVAEINARNVVEVMATSDGFSSDVTVLNRNGVHVKTTVDMKEIMKRNPGAKAFLEFNGKKIDVENAPEILGLNIEKNDKVRIVSDRNEVVNEITALVRRDDDAIQMIYRLQEAPEDVEIVGQKGLNLIKMEKMGIPVPPAFILRADRDLSNFDLELAQLQVLMEPLNGAVRPVSVRSSPRTSVPGLMDTILNVGMNEGIVNAISPSSNKNNITGWKTYSKYLADYGVKVLGMSRDQFPSYISTEYYDDDYRFYRSLAHYYVDAIKEKMLEHRQSLTDGADIFSMPFIEQVYEAAKAIKRSADTEAIKRYLQFNGQSPNLPSAVIIQQMVFGNLNDLSGSFVLSTYDPVSGQDGLYVEYAKKAQGDAIVNGEITPKPIAQSGIQEEQLREIDEITKKLQAEFGKYIQQS